jgi:Bifunctional DNA primase/polymerase, N-terminal
MSPAVTLGDALRLHAAGMSVLPVRADGSKQPALSSWREFQASQSSRSAVECWFRKGRDGVGVVPGAASGNLESVDFDDLATFDAYLALTSAAGLDHLVRAVTGGYSELTPRGVHLFYRCDQIGGNAKLASRPEGPDKFKTLVETRGRGGFVIVAPSGGRTHPSGLPYRVAAGSVETIATISADERTELLTLARSLDEMPLRPPIQPHGRNRHSAVPGRRPGDRFNARTSWAEVLEPYGWTHLYDRGEISYWRRPGKDHGLSATTNATGRDSLIVFSTSTPFEPCPSSYDRFGARAVLEFNGNLHSAANALRKRGIGWT